MIVRLKLSDKLREHLSDQTWGVFPHRTRIRIWWAVRQEVAEVICNQLRDSIRDQLEEDLDNT